MRARGSQPEHGQRPAAAEAAALVGATEAPPVDAEAEIRSVAGLLALCLGDVAGEDQQEKGEEGVHKTMAGVFRLSDEHWARIEPLLPVYVNIHRFGGGRPRVSDRKVMDAIFFVLRTGAQWRALDVTGICHGATAHRRFQQWREAGVFKALWEQGLLDYDGEVGIEWEWLSVDGSMGKAPLGGSKTGRNPTDRGKLGHKRSVMCEALGIPVGLATEGANRNDCK